jgi:hypothetical protein
VRNAAGQLPDGVHLLRLEQLRERGLALARPVLDALLQLPRPGRPRGFGCVSGFRRMPVRFTLPQDALTRIHGTL